MVDSATEFRKSGFNEEDSATLAGVAAMYQNVADDAISAGESANFIISQMKAFGLEAEDATHIIDALNEVSNTQAVSSADLANNLGKASAAMALGNNTYEQSLAMMTAITEINRSGAKSARALVSVQSRLTQVLDEQSSTGKALIEIYDGLGIALKDQNGQLRPTFEIFKDLAKVWPNLTTNQKDYIALTQAGANQTSNFVALMDNFESALKAEATAMESSGSAARENAAYMESLEAQTTQLKATFQDFANNVIDKELVSSALKGLNTALEVLNTPIGKAVTQWTLLTGVLTGGLTIYGQIAGKLIGTAKDGLTFASAITGAGTAASGAAVGFGTLAATALPIAAALSAIAVAGWKVYEWYKETHKPLQEYTDEVRANEEQLKKNQERLEEINKMSWADKSQDILNEKEALEKENEALKENIALNKQRSYDQAKRQADSTVEVTTGTHYTNTLLGIDWKSYQDAVEDINKIYGEGSKTAEFYISHLKEVNDTVEAQGDALNNYLIKALENYNAKLEQGDSLSDEEIAQHNNIVNAAQKQVEAYQLLKDSGVTLTTSQQSLIDVYNSAVESEANIKEWTEKYGDALIFTDEQVKALTATMPELKDQLVDTGNGWTILSNHAFSAADSLMSADGRIKKSSKDRTQSVLKDLQNLIDAYYSVVSTFAKAGTSSGITATQAKEANELARSLDAKKKQIQAAIYRSEKNGYYDDTKDSSSFAPSKTSSTKAKQTTDDALKAFNNYYKDLRHQREIDEIDDATYYKKLEGLVAQYKANATAHMKEYGLNVDTINRNMYQYEEEIYNGLEKLQKESLEKQTEQLKEALEAQKKTWEDYKQNLEDQKDDMDAVASYAVEYASRQIDEIETELESIEDQINAVNQKYDDQIKALEDANDELDKQIERERLLEDLASAKSEQRIVFKDGRFQYVSDVDEISSAQSAIDDFDRQQELEKQKAFIESQRENELEGLKNDEEILKEKKKRWEEYKDGWSNLTNDYEYEQNRLIATQQYGIEVEKGNWTARLNALEDFKSQYISKLKEIEAAQAKIDAISGAISVVSNSSKSSSTSGGSSTPSIKGPSKISSSVREAFRSALSKRYANGTLSASGGLSLVGENGPELRVLKPRSGIIPSDITRNLWNWGSIDPNILTSLCGSTTSYTFQIDKLSLPNVQDAKSLVEGLKNLAYQRAYKRA